MVWHQESGYIEVSLGRMIAVRCDHLFKVSWSVRLALQFGQTSGGPHNACYGAAFGYGSNQNFTKRRTSAWSTKCSLFAKLFQGQM